MHQTSHTHSQSIFQAFEKQAEKSRAQFSTKHPHAADYFRSKGILLDDLRRHAAHIIASGAIGASVFLSSPAIAAISQTTPVLPASLSVDKRQQLFAEDIRKYLPVSVENPTQMQEHGLSRSIWKYWGIDARATFQGQRLGTVYGFMGAEQHLPRYPGDTVQNHEQFIESGITPATGAWSYFAHSKEQLTQEMIEQERWYVAVQTLYLPDWNTNTTFLKNWYKYRKVLVVNPANGKTVVCDIADAGPAKFTGKQFGGSPEVMNYLGLDTGMKKGAVLLYFIDDEKNTISLGPVQSNPKEGKPYPHE